MSNYYQRKYEHDEIAIPYLQERLKEFGLSIIPHGIEIHDTRLREFLRDAGRTNPNALRDRYKPDIYIVPDDQKLKIKPILCEIKSENKGHTNFAIEFDSYCSGKIWDNGQRGVMYAFIKLIDNNPIEISCCWLSDVKISHVNVPKRFDFNKTITELSASYPDIEFKPVEYTSGSGTAFFIIRGNSIYLRPFDKFISDYITGNTALDGLLTPEQKLWRERNLILNRIGQSHLRPGMNLHKVNLVLAEYGIITGPDSKNKTADWDKFTLEDLRAIDAKLV